MSIADRKDIGGNWNGVEVRFNTRGTCVYSVLSNVLRQGQQHVDIDL